MTFWAAAAAPRTRPRSRRNVLGLPGHGLTMAANCYASPICLRMARASAVSGRSSSQMIEK
jgi:hypothetical protein